MITVKTYDIDPEVFESDIDVHGSGKEIIRDFYSLFDFLEKDRGLKLLYNIAKRKYENKRGKHENKN